MASGISSTVPSNTLSPVEISTLGVEAMSGKAIGSTSGVAASLTWFSANRASFVPFVVNSTFACARIWWFNGAAVSGNVDAGVYNEAGTRLASIGSTAQAGTTAVQSAALVATLVPGRYYMALVLDNATGTIYFPNNTHSAKNWWGLAEMATAFVLPATATLATPTTNNQIPIMGITTRTFV